MAPRIATVAAALLLDRVIPSIPSLHLRGEMNPAIWQMQLAAVPKLLPQPEMARNTPYDAACEVQGRLLAGLGQWGDRILVVIICGVHTALGEFYRAQHDRQLARRLPLHTAVARRFRGKLAGRHYCARYSATNRNGCGCPAARLCISPPPH
jgi:hypothetical protein